MRTTLRYFAALVAVAMVGAAWIAVLFTVWFPSQIEGIRVIPRDFLHPTLGPLLWVACFWGIDGIAIGDYYERQEDRIAYLSREDILALFTCFFYMNIGSFVLIPLIGTLDMQGSVIVRWIIFLWLSANILSILHVSVAETAHRYNKLQESKSQQVLQAGTDGDFSASNQPT